MDFFITPDMQPTRHDTTSRHQEKMKSKWIPSIRGTAAVRFRSFC